MAKSKLGSAIGKIAIVLAVLAGIFGFASYASYETFQQRIAKLKETGDLIPLDGMVRNVEDPQQDALTFLRDVFPISKALSPLIPRGRFGYIKTDPASIAHYEKSVAPYPHLFADIALAADAPEMSFGFDAEQTLNFSILELQTIAHVLDWRGHILLAQGDHAGAAQVGLDILRLGKLFDQPLLLSALLSRMFRFTAYQLIYESVSRGELEGELVEKIVHQIDQSEHDFVYENALKAELATSLYFGVNWKWQHDGPSSPENWFADSFAIYPGAFWGNWFLDQMDLALARSRMPLIVQFPETDKSNWLGEKLFGSDLTVTFNHLRNMFGNVRVRSQALRIVLALSADPSAADRDAWPVEFLNEIGISNDIATDPYCDKPLIIRRERERWIVYSVGPDQLDDNGRRDSDDIGFLVATDE